MASITQSFLFLSLSNSIPQLPSKFFTQIHSISSSRTFKTSISSARSVEDDPKTKEPMSIDDLHSFFDLNVSKWHGSSHQFDAHGKLMQKISTKLSVSTYGEDDLMSLIQTVYIKQPPSDTSISGYDEEPEWAEYNIKETNMFTVDKYQQ